MRRKNTSYWSLSCDHGRYCSDELYCDNNHNNNDNNNCCYSTAVVPKMQQAKCSVHVMYILLLYTRAAVVVVVDAHNEAPGISRYYTHDDIRAHIKGACFAIPASPPTTLGWPDLQWV